MVLKNLAAVFVKILSIVLSIPLIVVRQQSFQHADLVANPIEILLKRLEADEVIDDKLAILVIKDRVLRSRQMTIVMAFAG